MCFLKTELIEKKGVLMFGYDWGEITVGVVLTIIFLLIILLIVKIFRLVKERKQIRNKWVESYKRRKDGGMDLLSKSRKLVDNIPPGSECSCALFYLDSIEDVMEMFFLTKDEKRRGPFYIKFNTGEKIRKIFTKTNCHCDL